MTTLEHYGIKGMKWGNRKSYDSVYETEIDYEYIIRRKF